MKADKTALQRALRRLEGDEATLKSDTASGRMSAESKDGMQGYSDAQAVKSEGTDIAADKGKGTGIHQKQSNLLAKRENLHHQRRGTLRIPQDLAYLRPRIRFEVRISINVTGSSIARRLPRTTAVA
jgi:hypothetical protein